MTSKGNMDEQEWRTTEMVNIYVNIIHCSSPLTFFKYVNSWKGNLQRYLIGLSMKENVLCKTTITERGGG